MERASAWDPLCPTPVAGRQSAEGARDHTLPWGRECPGRRAAARLRVRPRAALPQKQQAQQTRHTRLLRTHTPARTHCGCLTCTSDARAARDTTGHVDRSVVWFFASFHLPDRPAPHSHSHSHSHSHTLSLSLTLLLSYSLSSLPRLSRRPAVVRQLTYTQETSSPVLENLRCQAHSNTGLTSRRQLCLASHHLGPTPLGAHASGPHPSGPPPLWATTLRPSHATHTHTTHPHHTHNTHKVELGLSRIPQTSRASWTHPDSPDSTQKRSSLGSARA